MLLHGANARVPSRLDDLVVHRFASEHECKWSLSGPSANSKVEGAVQQRYSYPKGRPEYSNTKGVGVFAHVMFYTHLSCTYPFSLLFRVYIIILGFIVDNC